MKRECRAAEGESQRSLPSRERGLKQAHRPLDVPAQRVAPFTGAWIETIALGYMDAIANVAPFTGAWIETGDDVLIILPDWVAPFTGAWIETCPSPGAQRSYAVAPFTGAWIETGKQHRNQIVNKRSLPSRERGLKRLIRMIYLTSRLSLPSRERGLKRVPQLRQIVMG